jgi:signal transduction histidine kinase/CheY-like chemotaxis protein
VSDDAKDPRVEELLAALEHMAGGDLDRRVPISTRHDEIDAIAHGVNVLVGELRYTSAGLQRAKHEAEEANRAKTAFLRNISHEIRTPLSAILGLAELLATTASSDERRRELQLRVLSNGRVLLALVDDLLDLAKVEAGRLQFERVAVAPLAIVAETVANLEIEANRKGLRLSVEAVGTLPDFISTDPKRLRQILTNLVGNAIKFTEHGTITVRVACAAEGSRLVIEVADTGIGLTAEQSAGLFALFQQGDRSIALRFGGSGLGLALSRRIAEGLGGTLEIASTAPGVGTTFRIALPATTAVAPAPPTGDSRPSSGRALAGIRLLLVDDNGDIRESIRELLEFAGAEVVEADGGLAAVTLAQTSRFDLVLMDVRMPDLDGLEATRRLRRAGARMPIVALTADAVEEHRHECLAAGYDERVTKPVELARLIEVVDRLVREPHQGWQPSHRDRPDSG